MSKVIYEVRIRKVLQWGDDQGKPPQHPCHSGVGEPEESHSSRTMLGTQGEETKGETIREGRDSERSEE
jgi:hypothetical protein